MIIVKFCFHFWDWGVKYFVYNQKHCLCTTSFTAECSSISRLSVKLLFSTVQTITEIYVVGKVC